MPKQNVRKFNEPILAPDFLRIDGTPVGGSGAGELPDLTPAANMTAEFSNVTPIKITISFTDLSFTIPAATDFATFPLVAQPNTNMLVLSSRATITGTKTQTNSIAFAVGTTAATSATLNSTRVDILASDTTDTSGLSFSFDQNGIADGTVNGPPRLITPTLGGQFHLNMQHVITSDSEVTISGTIEITYIDGGGPVAV